MKPRLVKSSARKSAASLALKVARGEKKARLTKAAKKPARSSAGSVGSTSASRASAKKRAARPAPRAAAAESSRRRDSKVLQSILARSRGDQELYLEVIGEEELLELFETSYPSELANLLLDLKKFTCRRLLETVVARRKRTHLDTITLYYYKDYLTSPLPLVVHGMNGQRVPNYYAIIGLPRDASDEEVHEASKLLIKAFQPESFSAAERETGQRRLEEIQDAYQHLRNGKRRQETDMSLPSNNYLYPRREQSWWNMVQRLLD
jgi:hypothetical protein